MGKFVNRTKNKEGKTPVTGHASGDKRTIQTLALVSLREF